MQITRKRFCTGRGPGSFLEALRGLCMVGCLGDDVRRLLRFEAGLFAEANQLGLAPKSAGSPTHAKCNQIDQQNVRIEFVG
jgi:hypothetical protein